MEKKLKNEQGSITIEFLGVIPYYFLFFIMLFQAIVSGYTIMTAQSAVNEAAKVYAVTKSELQAKQTANKAIGSGGALSLTNLDIRNQGNGYFEMEISTDHSIVLLPKQWRDKATIPFTHKTSSRVIE